MTAQGNAKPQAESECPPDTLSQSRLTAADVHIFNHALIAVRSQYSLIAQGIRERHGIAFRGPWIIGILGRAPMAPHQLADFFGIGRSLVTAELKKLIEAGLIVETRNPADGRRTRVELTPVGLEIHHGMQSEIERLFLKRLAHYSREDLMLCARIWSDFANPADL